MARVGGGERVAPSRTGKVRAPFVQQPGQLDDWMPYGWLIG